MRGLGNWDVDVPYLAATFMQGGERLGSSTWASNRCSGGSVPPISASGFLRHEYWQGISIHLPGEGGRSYLGLEAQTPVPSSGGPYRGVTSQRDVFDCIPMQNGLTGEGFRMTTASGVRYHFDFATSRIAAPLERWVTAADGLPSQMILHRTRHIILATRIEDRFGNTVQFTYNKFGYPTRIWSSDGREINLTYVQGRLTTVSSHGRTWQYAYDAGGNLSTVTLPDTTSWQYTYSNNLKPMAPAHGDPGSLPFCVGAPPLIDTSYVLTAAHPAGATGTFSFNNTRHYRSGVHASECLREGATTPEENFKLLVPYYFDVMSLESKSISGIGLAQPMNWTYDYDIQTQSLWGLHAQMPSYPCTTCTSDKLVAVTNPDGTRTRQRYGMRYRDNDGRLLQEEVLPVSGSALRTTTNAYMTEASVPGQPFHPTYGAVLNGDDPTSARIRPVVTRTINQNGVNFTPDYPCVSAIDTAACHAGHSPVT